MKKFLAILLSALVSTAHAGLEKSPTEMYDMSKLMTNNTDLKVVTVDNIRETCEKESRSRGFGGFGMAMDACSFWNKGFTGHTCVIFIGKKTNNDTLGHELRHCLQGNFH